MADAALIKRYFPELTPAQFAQFEQLGPLFTDWNSKINLVSRKDIDQLYLHHVLHSLSIAKVMPFADGSEILDIGTGGGFPGIPLAILYPKCKFTLVDSIGKKIMVVNELAAALQLRNVTGIHERAENIKGQFDFVISRAVTRMEEFIPLTQNKFKKKQINAFPNGILYLKGGDLTSELRAIKKSTDVFALANYFEEPFFETKSVVYVRMI
jgi:16S rRNA (guanine527-N7)-methyltransferase